ncbi:MAG: BcsE family c-di-GMP-binding protein [Methylobacter sp.]|uniref:BcsE family c-di-GMP-binding protein n=1 Tax=Candidatus Methylobacter titanis TaxID=3053457 RepID=A0AA43QA49_9GAMM|nr:BcsE family c-di-GMP-binding protein [Candidatus Methylobacter titanis]
MPKSGLCLACGKVTVFDNQNSVQTSKQLSERDSEIVSGQATIEEQQEIFVVETSVDEFVIAVVDDVQTTVLLPENVSDASDSLEDQPTLDIKTPANESASVVDGTQEGTLLLENTINTSDSIDEQQEIFVVETSVDESVAGNVHAAVSLSDNVGDTSGSVENQQALDIEIPANIPVKVISALNNSEYSIPESLIGIKKLDPCYGSIEKHGLFVITVPLFSLAKSILIQTIIHNPYIKTALISFEERNGLFNVLPEINKKLFVIYDMGNLLLNVVCIKDGKHLFSGIKQDMEEKAFASVDLVLINIEQDIIMSTTDAELAAILSSWQSWFIQHNKTCVWIVHGGMASGFVRSKFLKLSTMFNGLANIAFDASEIKYEVIFWHLHSSMQSNISLNLQFDEINHEISVTESNELSL